MTIRSIRECAFFWTGLRFAASPPNPAACPATGRYEAAPSASLSFDPLGRRAVGGPRVFAGRKRQAEPSDHRTPVCRGVMPQRHHHTRLRSRRRSFCESQRQKRIARFAQTHAPASLGIVVDRRCRRHSVIGGLITERSGEFESLRAGRPGSSSTASTPVNRNRSAPREMRLPGRLSSSTTSTPSSVHEPAPGRSVTTYVSLSGFGPLATISPLPGDLRACSAAPPPS